jgi:hypothetical protein
MSPRKSYKPLLHVGERISVLFLCHAPFVPRLEVEDPALYGSYVRRTVQKFKAVVRECCCASSSKPARMYSRCYQHFPRSQFEERALESVEKAFGLFT